MFRGEFAHSPPPRWGYAQPLRSGRPGGIDLPSVEDGSSAVEPRLREHSMVRRLAAASARHHRAVLMAWLLVLLAGLATAPLLFGRLGSEAGTASGRESQQVGRLLHRVAPSGDEIYAVVDGGAATDPALRQDVEAAAADERAIAGVQSVATPWSADGGQAVVARDGRAVAIASNSCRTGRATARCTPVRIGPRNQRTPGPGRRWSAAGRRDERAGGRRPRPTTVGRSGSRVRAATARTPCAAPRDIRRYRALPLAGAQNSPAAIE